MTSGDLAETENGIVSVIICGEGYDPVFRDRAAISHVCARHNELAAN